MFDPMAVKSASDLPKELPVVTETHGKLRLRARQPLAYNFHWLREVALGAIEGDLGLKIDAGAEAAAQLAVDSSYRQQISLDERGWLRLEILKSRSQSLDFSARVSASAQADTPLPDKPDALVAAILGIHEAQWPANLAQIASAASDTLGRLQELWKALASGGTGNGQNILAAFQNFDGWARKQIETLLGPVQTEADIGKLLAGLRTLLGLRDSVYEKAVAAVEKKYEADLSYAYKSASQETALLDCSFAFTDEGLAAYRQALQGDYSWILTADPAHVGIRQGLLTDGLQRQSTLELHLPFLDRKEWTSRLEVLARMEVSSDGDGRLLVYHVDASHRVACRNSYQSVLALAGGLSVGRVHSASSFTLSYSDQRRLPCAQAPRALASALSAYGFDAGANQSLQQLAAGRNGDLDVSLALSIPGSLVTAWLDAPDERSSDFFPVYARVSTAVQRAIRLWLPYVYFSDAGRYETLDAAFPLVVYGASRPFACKPNYDFSYDVTNEQSMRSFFRLAGQQLPGALADVEALLLKAGKKRAASFYSPKEARNILASVQQKPRLVQSLLVADTFLVNALVNLGCRAHRLRETSAKDPSEAVKQLTRFAADLVRAFHGKLRWLYGGQEFLAMGGLLLVEATSALKDGENMPSAIQAVLRLSQAASGGACALSQTLVNSAYLPSPN
jgi:hypothetical protein